MPTKYALLGATGSTGSAILRCLLASPPKDFTLNIFVRSKSKLLDIFPDLEIDNPFQTDVFEGDSGDGAALCACLEDVDVIFGCIGTNEATRGMSLIFDTAQSVIQALEKNRRDIQSYKTPTVIQLRSSSLNEQAALPWVARNMAWFFFYHGYEDLDRACRLYITSAHESPGLLEYIFVDPPSIHDAGGTTPTGHMLFLDSEKEKQEPAISYADLGVGFCEVAQRRFEFAGKAVLISATGIVNMTWSPLIGYMVKGAVSRVFG